MPPNIRIVSYTPPYLVGAVVARHALKDPDWTLRSEAGAETDEPVTVVVAEPPPAAPTGPAELVAENAALRLLLADSAARQAVAEAAAGTANADVDAAKKEAERIGRAAAADQALFAKQAAMIAQLEAQAKVDAKAKAK